MVVGSIVYSTFQGLGVLAKDFYDNGIFTEVLVMHHRHRTNNYDWYPNRIADVHEFLDKIDVLLLFETFFDRPILDEARKKGKKIIMMPMYECTPYKEDYDLMICPSALDYQIYNDLGENCEQVTVPVPDIILKGAKQRKKAEIFVHNAGNGGLGGRNGTKELIEAMRYVKSPIKLIIRTQLHDFKCNDPRVDIRKGTFAYEHLYQEGDVFIFPEKFNGLSLPMQEAYASGMPVMCGERFPMTEWLQKEFMFPVKDYTTERTFVEFKIAQYNPSAIAKKIDEWYGKDISSYSQMGIDWGRENSWSKLKSKYINICQ